VLAYDEDEGINGEITYSAKSGKSKGAFFINPDTGVVYTTISLESGGVHELNVISMPDFA
jgi:hypothetical protein